MLSCGPVLPADFAYKERMQTICGFVYRATYCRTIQYTSNPAFFFIRLLANDWTYG